MQIPPGQGGPTAAFFQALQGTPRADSADADRDSAKPVAKAEGSRAVEAASRSEQAVSVKGQGSKDGGRDFPRGSFVDIRT